MKKITLKPRGKDNNFSRIGTGLSIQDGVLSASGTPLIINGNIDTADIPAIFTPEDGEPSYADAKDAFLSGRVVILRETGGDSSYMVINYSAMEFALIADMRMDEAYMIWRKPEE